jgi:anti-sigma factor RsiW
MSRRCLSNDIADLVDGRLGPMATEQAHAHLASCARCRAAVIAQREASARLRSMRDAAPEPEFMRRLSAIASTSGTATALPVQNSASVVMLSDYRDAGARRSGVVNVPSLKKTGMTVISVAGLVSVATLVGVSGSQVAVSVPSVRQSVAPMITTFSNVERPASVGLGQQPFSGPSQVSTVPAYLLANYSTGYAHRSFHLVP